MNRTNVELKHQRANAVDYNVKALNRTNVELKLELLSNVEVGDVVSLNRTNVELKLTLDIPNVQDVIL